MEARAYAVTPYEAILKVRLGKKEIYTNSSNMSISPNPIRCFFKNPVFLKGVIKHNGNE